MLSGILATGALASDHDDGQTEVKSKALNLTDLFVFREGDQTGVSTDNDNLIFIMNTNDRSVARQQYYFNTNARYEFHVSRRADRDAPVTADDDIILRFEFSEPNSAGAQELTVTTIVDDVETSVDVVAGGGAILSTLLNGNPVTNDVDIAGTQLSVFAGLREDPFFFDVEQFFRLRAGLAGFGPAVGFRDADTAVDFTSGYNVNAIVVRVPIAWLEGSSGATTFDVWETISLLQQ